MKKLLYVVFITVMVICAMNLYACKDVDFKINFIVDEKIYATINTGGSETIKMPENPKKDGYTFDGWYWDKDVWDEPFTANSLLDTPLSSDLNVYAKWSNGKKSDEESLLVSATGFTLEGNTGRISVSNDTQTYSFINQIQVSNKATWVISRDIYGTQTIVTKTIPLGIGDNTVYLLITSGDNQSINLYTMIVRRRPIYTVSFNSNGGTQTSNQQIEEDSFVVQPTDVIRVGYTLTTWNYDFSQPVKSNLTMTAVWQPNTNTPYRVEYYLQNLENDDYALTDTENKTGTTDTTATVTKSYEHFTINEDTASANIDADGTTVLQVYYTRDTYEYSAEMSHTKAGTINCTANNTYKYGTAISLSATLNEGYDFLGWYNGEDKLTEELNYDFILSEDNNVIAKYFAHIDTSYKIEYYIQNLENNEYTLQEDDTEYLTGVTDTPIVATKSYEHFTVVEGTDIGNIDGDGNAVLKVYFTRDTYSVVISASNSNVTISKSYNTTYKYGYTIPSITASINDYLGYEWKGWYKDNEFVQEEFVLQYFVVDDNVNYVANYAVREEMQIYYFTSTKTTCEITDVRNINLTEYIIPDYVTRIDSSCFGSCTKVTSIYIPDSVTSIGSMAFSNCSSLQSVYIGNSVNSIGDYAFALTQHLQHIYFRGTEEDWNSINKTVWWDQDAGEKFKIRTYTIHYNCS